MTHKDEIIQAAFKEMEGDNFNTEKVGLFGVTSAFIKLFGEIYEAGKTSALQIDSVFKKLKEKE